MASQQSSGNRVLIWLILGGGGLVFACGLCGCVGLFWLGMTGDDAAVRLAGEMSPTEVKDIRSNCGLMPDEQLIVYWDATMTLDGSDVALVTDRRVIRRVNGNTTSIPLAEVIDITHSDEGLLGDVITVESETGQLMVIEIAPLNGGDTFLKALENARDRAQGF